MDPLATMTPDEYRSIRTQLTTEGLWQVGGNPAAEHRSANRAEQLITEQRTR